MPSRARGRAGRAPKWVQKPVMRPSFDQPQHSKHFCQLNLRICSVWPCSWFHFLRFCDQIGWHGFGQAGGPSSPHIGQTVQNWTGQLGVANRMCKDAFDWPTTGRAGDGPALNSVWRPDVNRLAIQTQMAQRPKHQCQRLQLSWTLMSKPLPHHCQ